MMLRDQIVMLRLEEGPEISWYTCSNVTRKAHENKYLPKVY
jgi:hypothetical protein